MQANTVSERERISHVVRRLGYGSRGWFAGQAASLDEAIDEALDLGTEAEPPPPLAVPETAEAARGGNVIRQVYQRWLEQTLPGDRPIEQRLVWFWHDHFAIDLRKVGFANLVDGYHVTLRRHATGNFGELLRAMATDPAMLFYLDGVRSSVDGLNENYGREVLELHTVGPGNFSEADVLAAARAFSGWVVAVPGERTEAAQEIFGAAPWESVFVPFRHDGGSKSLLGVTGDLVADDAVDVLLAHEATARHIATKLFIELVGLSPLDTDVDSLAAAFRQDYEVMDLVRAIVDHPAFLSDAAVRSKVRSPLEQAIGVLQAVGAPSESVRSVVEALSGIGYFPFRAPNPAGYPSGERLLSPHRLVRTFDLAATAPPELTSLTVDELLARLGIFDVSDSTRAVVGAAPAGPQRWALAVNSPEHQLV